MTRATVGGINSEDNLWYPLAVNSQGIAQIDTSGIPEPMQWETTKFLPEFGSDDAEGSALIEYDMQYGWLAKLANLVWLKIQLRTTNVALTNPRGNLIVRNIPYTWALSVTKATYAGPCVSYARGFRNDIPILNANASGQNLSLFFTKLENGIPNNVQFTDLLEGSNVDGNYLLVTHFGIITSTDAPPARRFVDGILQGTDEIPTGTP